MPLGNFPGRPKSELQIGMARASELTNVCSKLQQEYDSLVGGGPRGPIGMPGFDNLYQVLEYVEKVESSILSLRASIDKMKQNEGQQLAKIDAVVSKYVEKIPENAGVTVTKENDPELLKYGIEDCVKCEQQTLYWWRGGVMPLCPTCATLVTEDWCLSHAKWNKYGPLKENDQ